MKAQRRFRTKFHFGTGHCLDRCSSRLETKFPYLRPCPSTRRRTHDSDPRQASNDKIPLSKGEHVYRCSGMTEVASHLDDLILYCDEPKRTQNRAERNTWTDGSQLAGPKRTRTRICWTHVERWTDGSQYCHTRGKLAVGFGCVDSGDLARRLCCSCKGQ